MAKTTTDDTKIEETSADERLCKIEALKKDLNKRVGDGMFLTSLLDESMLGVDVVSTGILSLDIALGVGGIPRGRITEIAGKEQSGKTTIALQIAANAQKRGLSILYIDAESALDPVYCENLGLDINRKDFIICQPTYGEQALDTALEFIQNDLIDVVVIDSIASLNPKKSVDRTTGDGSMEASEKSVGTKARMMGAFVSAAVPLIKKHNVFFVALNQVRQNITPMGSFEDYPGGNAWKHAVSVRIQIRRTGTETGGNKTDESSYGISGTTIAHVKKNKVGPPHKQAVFDIIFGEGANYYTNLAGLGDKLKVGFQKAGAWWKILDANGEHLKSIRYSEISGYLKDNPEHLSFMVDEIGKMNNLVLFDPSKPEQKLGPAHEE